MKKLCFVAKILLYTITPCTLYNYSLYSIQLVFVLYTITPCTLYNYTWYSIQLLLVLYTITPCIHCGFRGNKLRTS